VSVLDPKPFQPPAPSPLDLIRTGYRYPPHFQAAAFCCSGIALHSGCCSARRARLGDLVELAGLDVIDETVNRDVFRHQGMTANSLDILGDAFGVVIEGVPVDVVTGDGAPDVLRIRPGVPVGNLIRLVREAESRKASVS
jgi:hypothetical protein